MCMNCNKPRVTSGNTNSTRQAYTPPRRIQGTNVRRAVHGNSGFGAPKAGISFARKK